MPDRFYHSWNMNINEARSVQKKLANNIREIKVSAPVHTVAGFDVSYLKEENKMIAGMVLLKYPSLDILESVTHTGKINFPYIPGYLSFREAPLLIELINNYIDKIDVFIFDGHGIAHPRGLGIASHIGVLIQKPSIGCAKKKLVGQYNEPGKNKGDVSDLYFNKQLVAKVLRTRNNVKPVFVSVGNLVTLNEALRVILNCVKKFRIPEPTRLAHNLVTSQKQNR